MPSGRVSSAQRSTNTTNHAACSAAAHALNVQRLQHPGQRCVPGAARRGVVRGWVSPAEAEATAPAPLEDDLLPAPKSHASRHRSSWSRTRRRYVFARASVWRRTFGVVPSLFRLLEASEDGAAQQRATTSRLDFFTFAKKTACLPEEPRPLPRGRLALCLHHATVFATRTSTSRLSSSSAQLTLSSPSSWSPPRSATGTNRRSNSPRYICLGLEILAGVSPAISHH